MSAFPGGTPTAASLDRVAARPAGVPAEPRRPRRVGQLGGAATRGHRPEHARPRRRPHRARRRRQSERHPARGRDVAREPAAARDDARHTHRGTAARPGVPALVRRHGVAGRDRRHLRRRGRSRPRLPRRRGIRHADRAASSARSGGTARADSSRSPSSSSSASATGAGGSPRRASRSCRTASPRTSRRRCSSRTATGTGTSTDNSGISFVPPEILNEAVPLLDALGFQVHFHAIGDRAVRECLDAVEQAIAAQRPQRQPPPHRAHPGRAPRRHPAVPRARRRREHAVAVGDARAADGRAHPAVPRLAARRVAVPVRRPAALGRGARRRQRLVGVDAEPARRDPRRR